MTKIFFLIIFVTVSGGFIPSPPQTSNSFHVTTTFHIPGKCNFDDLTVGPNNRLYISHESYVNVLDENTGDSVAIIPNTPGVHGIALAPPFGKGYTSDGASNKVTVFDLQTNKVLGEVPTGKGPDAILYDPYSRKVITCNETSHDLSVIDPATDMLIATIPLSGSTEGIVSNGKGKLYVNIKKGFIDVINIDAKKLEKSFPLGVDKRPLGLALDPKTNRLFSATFFGQLIVLDADNGHIIDSLHIGLGSDGVAFDPSTRYVFTSNSDTTLSVIKEISANNFKVVTTVRTATMANTMTIDPASHSLFLSAPMGRLNGNAGIKVLIINYN